MSINWQKGLYFLLIAGCLIVSLYFWTQGARTFLTNHSLSAQTSAQVIQWEVEEIGSDQYAICAHFTFVADGQNYHGKTLFTQPIYINSDIAIVALKERAIQASPLLYSRRPQTWNFDRAKATGFDDRKRVHISNIDPLTIVESRELSRRSKSKFVADGSIAWYCPDDPTRNSLEKSFSLNVLIRALIATALFFYFLFIRKKIFQTRIAYPSINPLRNAAREILGRCKTFFSFLK